MDPVRFVNSLELADITSEFVLSSEDELPELLSCYAESKNEGYVDAGSLVAFTEKLTEQNKADVMNSTLLAQLAANKKHVRNTEADKWYKEYVHVLENVGWVLQNFSFTEYKSDKGSFEISKVVVELFLAVIGDSEPVLLDIVKKTLDALKNSSSDTIKLFGSNSTSTKSGNFQIITSTLDKSGQVTVAFLGSYFKASKVEYNFLFFSYKDTSIELRKSTNVATLNEGVYNKVRQLIVDKLGNRAQSFVKHLDI